MRLLGVSGQVAESQDQLLQAMLIMVSIIRVGQSKFSAIPIDEDSQERVMNCIETLARMKPSAASGGSVNATGPTGCDLPVQ
jgi:coatomer subunit beta